MNKIEPVKADVDPESIVIDPEFVVRQGERDKAHIRTLAQRVRSGQRLDRVLLWRDPSTGSNALTLIDGAYRLSAYKTAGWPHAIPANIVECDRKQALLLAAGANAKDRKGTSPQEKQDYAWKLVRDESVTFSKSELVRYTGVSDSTIARMRSRWKALKGTPEQGATGHWWRDRDEGTDRESPDDLSDAARAAAIKDYVGKFRDLFDRRKGHPILSDTDAVFEIIGKALGPVKVRHFAEHHFGGPEELDSWLAGNVEPMGQYHHLTQFHEGGDEVENPDF